jgi:peroxiredoxin
MRLLAIEAANYLYMENQMSRVSLSQIAPDFSLPDFAGNGVSLSDFLGRKNVLLVFNRTFT